jgi:serine/threonine protein kinase
MADVYCAKPVGKDAVQRLVAIKCMRPDLGEDDSFAEMFIDEAKLASRLSHAHIVQVLDLGRIDGNLYIAMELISGRDVGRIIKRARDTLAEIPLGICAYILARAAEALGHAHGLASLEGEPLHLFHGDVSPQNILVSFDGEVKVADFGIARARGRSGATLQGKFAYMAPEQAVRGTIDYRVDIFALGATLFELITGEQLYHAESQLGVLEKVRTAEIPNLEMTDPRIQGELLELLNRALALAPDQRHRSAVDFAEALNPFLIEDNKLVGARHAAELLAELFADEVEEDRERLNHALALRRPMIAPVNL